MEVGSGACRTQAAGGSGTRHARLAAAPGGSTHAHGHAQDSMAGRQVRPAGDGGSVLTAALFNLLCCAVPGSQCVDKHKAFKAWWQELLQLIPYHTSLIASNAWPPRLASAHSQICASTDDVPGSNVGLVGCTRRSHVSLSNSARALYRASRFYVLRHARCSPLTNVGITL